MISRKSIIQGGLMLMTVCTTQAGIFTFASGPLGTAIPDGNPGGYVSSITVGGIPDTIVDVNVTLNIQGGYNGDLFGYLVSPNGGYAVLINRVGRTGSDAFGYGDAGFNIVLDDDAGADIHTYGGNGGLQLGGTWASDGRAVNPNSVTDLSARDNSLDDVYYEGSGLTANGIWRLFFADMSGGDGSTLMSWSLTVEAVPEPTTWAMIIFGAAAGVIGVCRRLRRGPG